MINLLHLSDLHFGYDTDETARAQRAQALDLLVKVLKNLDRDWRPRILVISGDLTYQGKPGGYTELGEWLTAKLFPATGLTPADCVICPGNHDVDRTAAVALLDRTGDAKKADHVLRPEHLDAGFARPFEAFVKFATEFGIEPPGLRGKANHLVGVRDLHGLRFICVNSAWFCRDSDTDRGQLWLGLPQLQSMALLDPDEYDRAPVTVAVLHHPESWLANAECNAYDNRPNTYGYLCDRAHVILSGHTHGAVERSMRCYDRARLVLGGAAYDNHAYRNNFSILRIDIDRRTVARRPWELDPRGPKWEEKDRHEYSLRIERLGRNEADPKKYMAWLRDQTQSIDLHQLKVAPGETPPPSIDALYIRLMTASHAVKGGEGAMERPQPAPLEEALRNTRLVIEGKPGGGKTTFLRRIAWMLCRPAGRPPDFPLAGFPLWVRISQLDQHIVNTLRDRRPGDPTTTADARWIAHYLAASGWELNEDFFLGKLGADDTVLLLDGLDEAANQTRREDIVEVIQSAASRYACRIVVTTRPGVHEGRATLRGFDSAIIDDLDDPGVDGFLLQWCRWLKRGDEDAAQTYYNDLRPAVAVRGIRYLARNPLMLTSLAVLHFRRHRLPEQRVKLYEQILDWLAEQAAERHPDIPKDQRLSLFGSLALGMQLWKGGMKIQVGLDTAAGVITPDGQDLEPARQFLEQAQIDSGIVTLRGGEIAFWHRSFQEYLAARALAGMPDKKLQEHARSLLYSPEGREVLPLLAGCMASTGKERLDDLFDDLIRHANGQKELEQKAHAVGVLGNMLSDVAPAKYDLTGAAASQYARLREAVMVIFEKGKAKGIGLKTRFAAAEALDQASQSRLKTPRDPEYWVEIKGSTFTIGDPEAYQSLPVRSVTGPTFRIGRCPVTVWEYAQYLEDTGAPAPEKWDEQVMHPSRPVVRVTWDEAQGYCEWAGCALPTDEQWESAARGTAGRVYPWGPEEPDEHRANFGMKVGEPTPVGMFPDGETPEGVADMAGNVWEWTRSDFDKGEKSVRGASFSSATWSLRAAVRNWDGPGDRGDNLGFRCVRE